MNMIYNIIGDIHGRTCWKELVKDNTINVFVGDYFSPYDNISFEDCKKNFWDIIAYKKAHWDNVVLLIGNHDEDHWHIREGYSRFDEEHWQEIVNLFENNKECFQIAYSINNHILVTHAGVSVIWYDHYKNHTLSLIIANCNHDDPDEIESPYTHEKIPYENPIKYSTMSSAEEAYRAYQDRYYREGISTRKDPEEGNFIEWNNNYWRWNGEKFVQYIVTPDELASFINDLWLSGRYSAFNFSSNAGYNDYCGNDERHGPMWIRPSALIGSNIFKYTDYWQVVGHTQMDDVYVYSKHKIVFCDCLGQSKKSYVFEE